MSRDAIILFIRYPEPGSERPGLARDLGAGIALELEICFIRDLLEEARHVDALTIVVGTGATGSGPPGLFGGAPRLLQHGRDVSARRYNAFADVFAKGVSRAVMLLGTSPGLPGRSLRAAFGELDSHDAVLGPGKGGDYYLAGLREGSLSRDFFQDMPWNTPRVFMKTMGCMEYAGLEVSVLPQREDIGDREGLIRFAQDRERSGSAVHTLECIERYREAIFRNEII